MAKDSNKELLMRCRNSVKDFSVFYFLLYKLGQDSHKEPKTIMDMYHDTGITYGVVMNHVKVLHFNGYLEIVKIPGAKEKRYSKLYRLTDKGLHIYNVFKALYDVAKQLYGEYDNYDSKKTV